MYISFTEKNTLKKYRNILPDKFWHPSLIFQQDNQY